MSVEFIAAEMELFAQQAEEVDIIITTALIPGKPAPKLITAEMVQLMKPGSVIVDLAARNGGNCELTKADEKTVLHDVTILGYTDLPGRLPTQSSNLYANNIVNLLTDMTPEKDGNLLVNFDDVVVRQSTVTHQGELMYPPPKLETPAPPKPAAETTPTELQDIAKPSGKQHMVWTCIAGAFMLLMLWLIGKHAPPEFVSHFTVFTINVAGGFLVTHRMLGMFRKQD